MLIEKVENLYRGIAKKRNQMPTNVFRASSAGYCVKRQAYALKGEVGGELTPRRVAVFRHGDIIHSCLATDYKQALGDMYLGPDELGDNYVDIEGVKVSFHPDGAFQHGTNIGIQEIKSMSDYAFERAKKGEIDRTYLCQAWLYYYGTSFNPVVFTCYRKETSHVVEIMFDREFTSTVVTQRMGGDALQLATDDPIGLTQIETPFDMSVEQEVREHYRTLGAIKSLIDAKLPFQMPKGVDAIEDELVKVQGAEKASKMCLEYGEPIEPKKGGGWYTFSTGRRIAGFPCSYCPYIKPCLGAKLEILKDRPVWVMNGTN